jgi:hypothetical protein
MIVSDESDIARDQHVIADLECRLDVHTPAEPYSIADVYGPLSCKNQSTARREILAGSKRPLVRKPSAQDPSLVKSGSQKNERT